MSAKSIKQPTFDVQYHDDTDEFHVMRNLQEIFFCKASDLKNLGAPIHPDARLAFGRIILGSAFERASRKTADLHEMVRLVILDVAGPNALKNHQKEIDSLVAAI